MPRTHSRTRTLALVLVLALTLLSALARSACNVPRVAIDEDQEVIEVDSRNPAAGPVIFVMGKDRNAGLRSLVERGVLLDSHGDVEVILSSSNSYSHGTRRMSLRDYIEDIVDVDERLAGRGGLQSNESYYMFGHNDGREPWKSLVALNYARPPCGPTCSGHDATPTFGIGSPNSGTSFHFHGPAFSEAIIGSKRWFIYPAHLKPDMTQLANVSMWRWAEEILPSLPHRDEIYDCTISPGEVLWFPTQLYHATLNLEPFNVFMSLFV